MKTFTVVLALTMILSGCAKNPAFDRAMTDILIGKPDPCAYIDVSEFPTDEEMAEVTACIRRNS